MVKKGSKEDAKKIGENIDRLLAGELPTRKPKEEIKENSPIEARYYQDKATLDNQVKNSVCSGQDLLILNVLPENYYRWKKEQGDITEEEFASHSRIKIIQPAMGIKLIGQFADEIAEEIKDKNIFFFRPDSKNIVEIGKIKLRKDAEEKYNGFLVVTPHRFITSIERYIIPCMRVWNEHARVYEEKEKSINSTLATTLLESDILQKSLPIISRIFTIPLPIMYKSQLTFPKKGYDERFFSWLPYDSPEISNPYIRLEEAKLIIEKILSEFCFSKPEDKTHAIASLITPFLRGLYSSFNARTPVFFYLANRERAGKDYLAGIVGIIYEGHVLEEPPISDTEELRKKILSAFIAGRKRLHFSNNKGHIDNSVFEGIITSEKHSDRALGRNDILTFDNELDFSLSGNMGVTFTGDLANRCRFIRLFLEIEDANSRKFDNPNLHAWILNNRNLILSAFYALVTNWIEKGMPNGSVPFASFPNWASVCGGIMESAGYDNPCKPDGEIAMIGGDKETEQMKALFELCNQFFPNEWITKKQIKEIVRQDDSELFDFDFNTKEDQTRFGTMISRFVGRILSDIKLIVKNAKVRSARQEFKFVKMVT